MTLAYTSQILSSSSWTTSPHPPTPLELSLPGLNEHVSCFPKGNMKAGLDLILLSDPRVSGTELDILIIITGFSIGQARFHINSANSHSNQQLRN